MPTLFNGLRSICPLKTRFRFGSGPEVLNLASTRNSPDRSTKSTRLCFKSLPQLVNTGFQVLFHSPPGVLFTFPSQYYALSVTSRFLVSRCTLDPALSARLSLTGLSPSPAGFPKTFLLDLLNQLCGPNPAVHAPRFGLFPFRSPLLWKSMFLSFPPAT